MLMSALDDATLAQVFGCWTSWRGEEPIPSRAAVEPLDLGKSLPYVWLCERDGQTRLYRYRVVGEAVNRLYGRSLSGRAPAEVLPEETVLALHRRFDRVLGDGVIVHTVSPQTLHDRRHALVKRLYMPLRGTSGRSDTVFGCTKVTDAISEAAWEKVKASEAVYAPDGTLIAESHPPLTMFALLGSQISVL